MICKDNYIIGAYKRKHTKGYFQYLRYNYGTVKVDKAKGNEVVIDYKIDELYENNLMDKELYKLYYEKLKYYFRDFSRLEDYTDEAIYGDVHIIRQEVFGDKNQKIFSNSKLNEFFKLSKETKQLKFHDSILELIYGSIEKALRCKTSSVNQIELLKEIIKNTNKLIFIVGNSSGLYKLLEILANDLDEFGAKEIVIFLKTKSVYNEATINDYYDIINSHSISGLSKILSQRNIDIRTYYNASVGMDLRNLDKNNYALLEEACNNKAIVIGLGETNIFSLKNVNFDYFMLSTIQSVVVSRYTNIYQNGSDKVPYMISYVIKEFNCEEDFTGNERINISLYHYNCLLNQYGIDSCRQMFRENKQVNKLLPSVYMNFYSNTIKAEDFPALIINNYSNRNDYIIKKRKRLHSFINSNFDGKYISCYYNVDDISKIKNEDHIDKENIVFVTGLIFNNNVDMKAVEAEKINKSVISPREYARNEKTDGLCFYSNFLYFVTQNINEAYNFTREKRQMEKIDVGKIFLGYKYLNDGQHREETFPLYNKGYMGYTKSGKVIFGRRELLGGAVIINNEKISWEKEQVNTLNGNVSIVTPNIDHEKLSSSHVDFRNFNYIYGKDRLNIVIINNKIVCVRYGEVAIPSIGVVVSVKGKHIQALKKTLGLVEVMDGYYEVTKSYTIDLYLEKPDNITAEEWNDVEWAYGGATLLVEDGINLVETKEKQIEAFNKEGWFHPLSMQTQETQVQDWVRGPRTVIGLTDNGHFFQFVFSGRTKESCGANFNEIVSILEKEIGNISWAMNLDGGASSCLGLVYKNELIELSYPCVSNLSSAGMIRPINSMLIVK